MLSKTLHHAAIEVSDLDGAIEWYRDHLDFRYERQFELPDAGIEIAYMVSDALRIELLKRADGLEPAGNGGFRPSTHICFEVEDVDAAAEELRRCGVELAQEPKVIGPAGVKNLWIKAYEGHLIEYLEVL